MHSAILLFLLLQVNQTYSFRNYSNHTGNHNYSTNNYNSYTDHTNNSSFRISHGEEASMTTDELKHLVKLYMVYEFMDGYGRPIRPGQTKTMLTSCTGMKATLEQLQDAKLEKAIGSTNYVITALHCIRPTIETDDRRIAQLRQILVVSGTEFVPRPTLIAQGSDYTVRFKASVAARNVRTVEKFSMYNPGVSGFEYGDYNDLAILKLNGFPFTTPVIPLEFNQVEAQTGETCRYAGWGIDHNAKNDYKLKKVEHGATELLTKDECLKKKKDLIGCDAKPPDVDDEDWETKQDVDCIQAEIQVEVLLCTLHRRGSAPCKGDSGTPLMCRTQNPDGKFGPEKIRGVNIRGVGAKHEILQGKNKVKCYEQGEKRTELLNHVVNFSVREMSDYIQRCSNALERNIDDQSCYVRKLDDICVAFESSNRRQRRQAKECIVKFNRRAPKHNSASVASTGYYALILLIGYTVRVVFYN